MTEEYYVIFGLLLIAFGVTSTFFGGLFFDCLAASLAGILVFLMACIVTSIFTGFDAFETLLPG